MPRNEIEVPGSVLATQANIERIMSKTANLLHWAGGVLDQPDVTGFHLKQIRIKCDLKGGGGWMAVVTALTPNGDQVAFHRGDDFREALEGVLSRIRNGSLKWKDDEYA